MKLNKTLLAALSLTLTVACGKKNQDEPDNVGVFSVDEDASMVAAATNSISGMAEDSDSASVSSKPESSEISKTVAVCGRVAAVQACVNNARVADYDNCTIPYTDVTATGRVSLDYSSANCRLSMDGDSVSRAFDLTLVGPRGGRLVIKSEQRQIEDFANAGQFITIGNGGKLTKQTGGWKAEVAGRHIQILGWRGEELVNYSVRTAPSAPVMITGTLTRYDRVINSGTLEVYHNKAKYVAKFSANNLKYSANCCHPTSGTLSAIFAGSKSGSGSVEFLSCGTAKLTKNDGSVKDLQLGNCE